MTHQQTEVNWTIQHPQLVPVAGYKGQESTDWIRSQETCSGKIMKNICRQPIK